MTIPTPGVYSEGILGQRNTCETVDTAKFWDWQTSPCADDAPAIVAPPAPRASTSFKDLTPENIQSLISFATLTDPTSILTKELITALIAKADTGSVESKALLDSLIKSVLEALKATKEEPKKEGPKKEGTPAPDEHPIKFGETG